MERLLHDHSTPSAETGITKCLDTLDSFASLWRGRRCSGPNEIHRFFTDCATLIFVVNCEASYPQIFFVHNIASPVLKLELFHALGDRWIFQMTHSCNDEIARRNFLKFVHKTEHTRPASTLLQAGSVFNLTNEETSDIAGRTTTSYKN